MFDESGAPVKSLSPADLTVYEDGKLAKVLKIEPKISPMHVTLALDNGREMADTLVHVRTAAKDFFNALPPGMEAALMTTAPVPRFVVKATKDHEALVKAVDTISKDSSGGRTIEAIQDVSNTWKKLPADMTPVLVVLGSTYSPEFVNKDHLDQAFKQIAASRAVIHAVLYNPPNATEGDAQLETAELAANRSRGRFERIGSYLQLNILEDIAKDLAKTAASGQFLITVERPAGATGKMGALSMSPASGLTPGRITRIP
jgi:hypothetical protein